MGTLRFLLATCVLFSHTMLMSGGVEPRPNPGVLAVISFFLLSGYVMTGLVQKRYFSLRSVPLFFIDRMARLFPQYWLYLALTLLCLSLGLIASEEYLTSITPTGLLRNLLMLPVGYFMFFGWRVPLINPIAWSLGLELTFYLLFPFILLGRLRPHCFALSCLLFVLTAFGLFHTEQYGHYAIEVLNYRLIPGTLFLFLLGSFIFDDRTIHRKHPAVWAWIGCLLLLPPLYARHLLWARYTLETLGGLLIGIPLLFGVARCRETKWDAFLGNCSYGLFLSHFLIIWLLQQRGLHRNALTLFLLTQTLSFFASILSYYSVEYPVLRWRRAFRERRAAPDALAPPLVASASK